MGFEFDVSKLQVNMQAIRDRMALNGRRRAVRAGAQVIAEAMVERTPVQVEKMVGSDSLDPGTVKANTNARVRMMDGEPVGLAGPHGLGGAVGKVAYVVEYGHRMVVGGKSKLNAAGKFVGTGKVVGDVPPHPFLRPAFESSVTPALEAMGAELGAEFQGVSGE